MIISKKYITKAKMSKENKSAYTQKKTFKHNVAVIVASSPACK